MGPDAGAGGVAAEAARARAGEPAALPVVRRWRAAETLWVRIRWPRSPTATMPGAGHGFKRDAYRDVYSSRLDCRCRVTPRDAEAVGASEAALRRMARRGTLERRGLGIYAIPQLAADRLGQYQEALLWVREPGALSHDTALDLHDLCDINPVKVHVTVAPGTRLRRRLPAWLVVHHGPLDEGDRKSVV